MKRILRQVLRAETQAIAIYSAEIFWIRKSQRRAALIRIRDEEVEHQSHFDSLVRPSLLSQSFDRATGLLLGTLFAFLPWRTLCSVQSWAEDEAAKIYMRAEISLRGQTPSPPPQVLEDLRKAASQEREHSLFFRGPARLL